MGAWGAGLFADDLAADVRDEFCDLLGDGLTAKEATERLRKEYAQAIDDGDEGPVFWLALAATQWKLGRLEGFVKQKALDVISSRSDLARWDTSADRTKREKVLAKLRDQLLSQPPPPKKIRKTFKEASDWRVGEVVAFRLRSGRLALMRLIGYHQDKGGKFAVCELLDWAGNSVPSKERIDELGIKRESGDYGITQFLFCEPKTKKDKERVLRLGVISKPSQACGTGYCGAMVWPYVDRLFEETFNLK